MQDFFYIEDEPEEKSQSEQEVVLESSKVWCFPVVNGVRTQDSLDLIKGAKYGA